MRQTVVDRYWGGRVRDHHWRVWLRCFFLIAVPFILASTALAQVGGRVRVLEGGDEPIVPFGTRQPREQLTPQQRKIGRRVRRKIKKLRDVGITQSNAPAREVSRQFSSPVIRVDDRARIQSYIRLNGLEPEKLGVLRAIPDLVIEAMNHDLNVVQAWLPYRQIESIAALGFVEKITPPSYGRTRTGSVLSQGDAILNADDARALGVTGSGVKVGVISDGFDGLATAQGTNDLPPIVQTFGSSVGGEGVSMAEIIHDLAPDATLAICGGFTTVTFLNCVNDFKNTFQADVIVDDIGFFLEPYFEDGAIANAYLDALNNGNYVLDLTRAA